MPPAVAAAALSRGIAVAPRSLVRRQILAAGGRHLGGPGGPSGAGAATAGLRRSSAAAAALQPRLVDLVRFAPRRSFAADAGKKEDAEEDAADAVADADADGEEPEEEASAEEVLQAKVKDLEDQLLRGLAEQENIRGIAKRDVASARSYAVSSFAKSLLDTSDNLSRAMEAVPEEMREDRDGNPVLATLYEGIKMTDDNLLKAFAKNGLVRYGTVGEKFDPNLHLALFQYPDPESEVGTVGQVMKPGFKLNERVIRPAEVGTIKEA